MQLDNNGLYGTLPSTIVQLDTLAVLSLQYNDLSGTIPDQLFSVTSMQCVWRCWAAGGPTLAIMLVKDSPIPAFKVGLCVGFAVQDHRSGR